MSDFVQEAMAYLKSGHEGELRVEHYLLTHYPAIFKEYMEKRMALLEELKAFMKTKEPQL